MSRKLLKKKNVDCSIRSGMCCVVGCINRYCKPVKDVQFYKFPLEIGVRRQQWIKNVNRIDEHGVEWQPTGTTKICSDHFVGGKKSEDPRDEAYIPTVFRNITETTKHRTRWKHKGQRVVKTEEKRLKLSEINKDPSTVRICSSPIQHLHGTESKKLDTTNKPLSENSGERESNSTNRNCEDGEFDVNLIFDPARFHPLPKENNESDEISNFVHIQNIEENTERYKLPAEDRSNQLDKDEHSKPLISSRSNNQPTYGATTSTFEAILNKIEHVMDKCLDVRSNATREDTIEFEAKVNAKFEHLDSIVNDIQSELLKSEAQAKLTKINLESEPWCDLNALRIDNENLKKEVADLSLKAISLEAELRARQRKLSKKNSTGTPQPIPGAQIVLNADGTPTILCVTRAN